MDCEENTLTRLPRQVKQPERVRRCFTCSIPAILFRRILGFFGMDPSDTKKVGIGDFSNLELNSDAPAVIDAGAELGPGEERSLCRAADDVARRGISADWE